MDDQPSVRARGGQRRRPQRGGRQGRRRDHVAASPASSAAGARRPADPDGPARAAARAPPQARPPQDADEIQDSAAFDVLVRDVLKNPELLHSADLTAEQVLALQRRLNPYAGIAGEAPAPDRKKVAACSYTNLREDYLRRFVMTSLAGFLFQVYHEWEVPAEARRWAPPAAKADPAAAPYDPAKLVELLEASLTVAKEAQAAHEEAAALKTQAAEADLLLAHQPLSAEKEAAAEKGRAAAAAAARAAGLLYAATHTASRAGSDAAARLRATAEAGLKHPAVREVIGRFPLPPPPGQLEVPAPVAKEMVGGFLRHWLEFDPSVHVRAGHDAETVAEAVARVRVGDREVAVDAKDPGHLTLEAVLAARPEPAREHADAFETITGSRAAYNAAAALLRDEDLFDAVALAVANREAFSQYLFPVAPGSAARPAAEHVPPQDTFHRWGYYAEVNHEELRTITEALYADRPDLDWAIALWAVFEGTDAEVDAAFNKHCQRYQEEVPSAIKALEFGSWSLLADFKENRKKIQFYNKHTEVLKRILDRHGEDKRIGAELMRNRVLQKKAANIAADGPDAPGLKEYRRVNAEKGGDLGAKGAERVIGPEEMRRLEKARGSVKAARELELLEQTEKRIAELKELESLRRAAGKDLSEEERRELDHHGRELPKIREMVRVPDDAIQVDVYTSNPTTGDFGKSHFFTKAEAPEHIARARAEHEAAQPASQHPAVLAHTPRPARDAPAPEGPAAPPRQLAPYAVEYILREQEAARLAALEAQGGAPAAPDDGLPQ